MRLNVVHRLTRCLSREVRHQHVAVICVADDTFFDIVNNTQVAVDKARCFARIFASLDSVTDLVIEDTDAGQLLNVGLRSTLG